MEKRYKDFISLPKFEVNNMLSLSAHLQNKSYVQTKQPKIQPTFTCSKSAIETFEEGVKYVQK